MRAIYICIQRGDLHRVRKAAKMKFSVTASVVLLQMVLHTVEGDAIFGENLNLNWQKWAGSLPNGAVSIYNSQEKRTDYVCKVNCVAGFYAPNRGPSCYYSSRKKEHSSGSFEVLTNKDNFEFLEWKEGSKGSVPSHSVKTCSGVDIYVGKNKYGLGKVDVGQKAFFLPRKGKEYSSKTYQVLTINRDSYKQSITNVNYSINKAKIVPSNHHTMRISSIVNNNCQMVTKTVTLEKSFEVRSSWDIKRSTKFGIKSSITTSLLGFFTAGIEVGVEKTMEFSEGTTLVETKKHSMSVSVNIPPNQSCSVRLLGRQITAEIPFTARLSRTYSNGKTQQTSVSGVYDGMQIGEIRAEVDRCEPVANAKPCQ